MKREWDISCTMSDWGLGVEMTFPSRSERFLFGTKLQVHFGLTIYLGPFTIEWRKEPTVIEYESEEARQFYLAKEATED